MNEQDQTGSILLTALLFCLGTAVMLVGLLGAVTLAENARQAETQGRRLLAEAQAGINSALVLAEGAWEPGSFEPRTGLIVTLDTVTGASGRILLATAVAQTAATQCVLTAVVERGGDGFVLPWRAVTANTLACDTGRGEPVVVGVVSLPTPEDLTGGRPQDMATSTSGGFACATVTVVSAAPQVVLGSHVALELGPAWTLDPGTRALAQTSPAAAGVLAVPDGVSVRQALSLDGRPQLGLSGEMPVVLVGMGSVPLDATGVGELHAVLLSGSGGVDLDGTQLHGAAFTEGVLRFGSTGQIQFDEDVLEWAQHRSITRVRLVPGTRDEEFRAAGD
ncbi:MAG: hypothetical protein ACYCX3_03250 [Thermoleophilia bacterium]